MAKKNNNIGISFSADVVDLKTGIKQIKDEISKADKEFQKATAGMDKWSDNTEGLSAKLGQLNTKLNSQKKSVELYQAEIERVSKLEGNHSAELENLQKKLTDAEIAVKRTEKEVRKYSSSLDEALAKEKESSSSLSKLTDKIKEQENNLASLQDEYRDAVITYGKNSKEAKNLANKIKEVSSKLKDNKKQVETADKELELLEKQFDDTRDSAEDFSKGIDGIKNLGGTVAKGIGAIGAGIGALAGAFLATAEGTKEYRTNMGKLETGFETSGLKAEQAADTYKRLFSVVADEGKATEATAMLGQMAKSQEDLNKWVNISTGIFATFGDSLPIEGLAEAALETSKTGQLTGSLADALNWAGISEEGFQKALDSCTTEQERQKLITETLNKTYDDASKKYQQVNKDVIDSNKAQVELSDTMAKFGEKAEPLLTAIKEGFNQLLQEALKLTEGVDFDALAEKIKNGFQYFIDEIIPAIKDGFQWILDNKDVLIAGIVAIGTGMLAWNVVSIVQGVVGAIKAWTVATEGMTVAQRLMNLAMSANPIGIVITAVTALVAAFVVLWNKCDAFRQFWIDLWNGLVNLVKTVVNWIKENWQGLALLLVSWWAGAFKLLYDNCEWFRNIVDTVIKKIKEYFFKAVEYIKDAWSGVSSWFADMASKIENAFKNIPAKLKEFFSNAWTNIKNAWSNVLSFFTDIKDKVINTFKELPAKMLTVGSDLVKGLWNGIKDMTSWVTNKIKGFTGDVLGGIKKFFGIKSPSKEMAKIGEYLDEGLVKGMEDGKDSVIAEGEQIGNEVLDAVANAEGKQELIALFNGIADAKEETKELAKEADKVSFDKANKGIESLKEKYKSLFSFDSGFSKTFDNFDDAFIRSRAFRIDAGEKLLKEFQELDKKVQAHTTVVNAQADALKHSLDAGDISKESYDRLSAALNEDKKAFLDAATEAQLKLKSIGSKFLDETDSFANEKSGGKFLNFLSTAMYEVGKDFGILSSQIEEWASSADGKLVDVFSNWAEAAVSKTSEVMTALMDLNDALIEKENTRLDEELKNYNKTKDAEIAKIEELAAAGLLSEEQATKAKEKAEDAKRKMEEETLRKKDELAEKQFNAQKATNIAMTAVNGATAIVRGFADLGPIAGAINAVIQAGITAAQIATIATQQYVPMLAKGGIVDSPTLAMIGEAGKEAVMPLENNTGWIKDLAEKISAIMSKDLSLDIGRLQLQPAYASVPSTTNYTQIINAPKTPSRIELYRDTKNLLALRR